MGKTLLLITLSLAWGACALFTNHGAPVYTYGPSDTENQRPLRLHVERDAEPPPDP